MTRVLSTRLPATSPSPECGSSRGHCLSVPAGERLKADSQKVAGLKLEDFVDRDFPKSKVLIELASPAVRGGDLQGDAVRALAPGPPLDAGDEGVAYAAVSVPG